MACGDWLLKIVGRRKGGCEKVKLRQTIRIIIDIAILLLLPVMMQYMLTEQELHEQLGVLMAVIFILHHALNILWFVHLFRGKYGSAGIQRDRDVGNVRVCV